MTKLCARGKSAAKRKFKVYPSAYANAYASKICAGKIKDPSGTKRKDWGPKKAFLGGLMKTKDKKKETEKTETAVGKAKKILKTKEQRLKELRKEIGMNKGGGADMSKIETKNKTRKVYGDRNKRRQQLKEIQNPISEYGPKGKLKYTGAKVGMNVTAGGQSAMGRLEKSGMRGGGIAIKGTNFKGVF
jgi:hypothetical protein